MQLLFSILLSTKAKPPPALGSAADLRPFQAAEHYNDSSMVYTYLDLTHSTRALSQVSDALDLLSLWAASWARHGWHPRILTRDDLVQRHPEAYREFVRTANATATAVSRARGHSSAKDATFRLRGLTQFFAKAVSGAGVLTDSDVINYGLTPQDVREASRGASEGSVVVRRSKLCRGKPGPVSCLYAAPPRNPINVATTASTRRFLCQNVLLCQTRRPAPMRERLLCGTRTRAVSC